MYCGPTLLLNRDTPSTTRLSVYQRQPILPYSLPSMLPALVVATERAESAPPTADSSVVQRGSQEAPPTYNHVASDTNILKMVPASSGLLPSTLTESGSSTDTCTASPSRGGGVGGVSGAHGLRLANSSIVFSSGSSELDSSREEVGDDSPRRVDTDWSPQVPRSPLGSKGQSTEMVPTGSGAVERWCEEKGDRCGASLDSDGLVRVCDEAHSLMRRREEQHRAEVGRLSEQLTRARLEAAAAVNVGGGASRGEEGQPPAEGGRSNGEREVESCSDENTVCVNIAFLY